MRVASQQTSRWSVREKKCACRPHSRRYGNEFENMIETYFNTLCLPPTCIYFHCFSDGWRAQLLWRSVVQSETVAALLDLHQDHRTTAHRQRQRYGPPHNVNQNTALTRGTRMGGRERMRKWVNNDDDICWHVYYIIKARPAALRWPQPPTNIWLMSRAPSEATTQSVWLHCVICCHLYYGFMHIMVYRRNTSFFLVQPFSFLSQKNSTQISHVFFNSV